MDIEKAAGEKAVDGGEKSEKSEKSEKVEGEEGEKRRSSITEAFDSLTTWVQDLEEIQDNLLKLPLLAVLLPREHDKEALKIFQSLSSQGVGIEVAAHTTYLNCPRTLWVLDWETLEKEDAITPALYLNRMQHLISEQTQDIRPDYGPWMWPLNDADVCSAIALSQFMDPASACWQKFLWGIRLLPPKNGSILARCIMEHYGRETGYVFAWDNLFARALWVLALPMLIFGLANVGPAAAGVDSIPWYIMQILTVLWGLCIIAYGSSRRSVLRSGAGLRKPQKAELLPPTNQPAGTEGVKDVQHSTSRPDGGEAVVQDVSLPNQIPETAQAAAVPPQSQTPGSPPQAKQPKGKIKQKQLAPRKMMEVKAGHKAIDTQQLAQVFVGESGPGGPGEAGGGQPGQPMPDFRLNPEYKPENSPVRRFILAGTITISVLIIFLSLAALVLSLLLQLKSYLIFEWGECIRLGCDNAGQKWGFSAVLVDISVDILMALVFIVGLGETCKALSFQLARVWNFKKMRRRTTVQTLLSLCIEVMAKVGLFTLLAFIFLPSWSETSINGSSLLPEEVCAGQVDYDLCRAMGNCEKSGDPYCCSGTLSCARQLLPFSARRSLFENWLVGPFVVAPFVDLIPAVLAPMLADHLADLADAGATSFCAKCCCCACGWLARFLAFIFVLDGEVTGIRYVCLGKTFSEPKAFHMDEDDSAEEAADYLDGALEQAVLRPWDAMEELKELKLNFLFVLLFAPLKPVLVLPTLLARLLEVRAKLQKLFLVKRRNIPRDARLVHRPQEIFTVAAVQAACFWHIGLALTAYNGDLWTWSMGGLTAVWFPGGLVASIAVFIIYRFTDKGD